jgi:thioredoxin reductase (NADPH)
MEAVKLETLNGYHILTLGDGSKVAAQAVIIATGVSYRLLDVPGADRLSGAGLFYGAAMTEALGVAGQDVFVVGAGNSAGQAALHLARYARSVTLLVRGKSLEDSMSKYLIERIGEAENVTVRTGASIAELHGEDSLQSVSIRDAETGETSEVPARAVFVFIGASPRTDWLKDNLQLDAQGFIPSGPDLERPQGRLPGGWTLEREPFWLETSLPGVFVAGDVRRQSTKRIASAVGEGAMAVTFVHQHLRGPAPAQRPGPAAGA